MTSLVPRLLRGREVEPGTHCSHMRKSLRKRVSKRIATQLQEPRRGLVDDKTIISPLKCSVIP